MITSEGSKTNLSPTDRVVLYPTFGYPVDGGQAWRILVRGAVYEHGQVKLRERLLIRMLQRVMKAPQQAMESDIFCDRIRDFTWSTEKGKRLAIQLGDRTYRLQKPSRKNGHFAGSLRLGREEVDRLRGEENRLPGEGSGPRDWLNFRVVTPGDASQQPVGRVRLLDDAGVSIISDIDDTVRHSDVGCRRALLSNTFLHEFCCVGGIVDLYQHWHELGAVFHYVSSSPWQLYRPLRGLWEQEGIPDGTFHLRLFRLRDHMLRRLLLLRPGKGAVIRSILSTLPNRRFVLIGDSGEHDPEIYAAAARKYRDRVEAIMIRQVPKRPMDAARCRRVFRHLPESQWHLFEEPEELRDRLPGLTCTANA